MIYKLILEFLSCLLYKKIDLISEFLLFTIYSLLFIHVTERYCRNSYSLTVPKANFYCDTVIR